MVFPVHLLQLDSLPDQSLCSHILRRSLMPSLSLSCSPSVTTHLHLPLPSPHLQSWQQLLFSHQVFFLHVWSQSFRLRGVGTQQFQTSKTEIPTLLLRTAFDRGCTKNPREQGEREAEAEGDPARGRFWEEGTPTRGWEWRAHPSCQPMVSPYLEGLCQRIQAGGRGGQCRVFQSLPAAQGSSVCKVSGQFLELLGIACCG